MKKILVLLAAILPMIVSAESVKIEGIWYSINTSALCASVNKNLSGNIYSGVIKIPEIVAYDGKEYRVTGIEESAFNGCSSITSIELPVSVTYIGDNAFSGCKSLTSVHISDITAWYNIFFTNYLSNPLWYAHHLYLEGQEVTDLVIPDSLTIVNNYSFCGCSGLTSITIPNSITYIGNGAFYGCSGLSSVTIPNSVKKIGEWAFRGCSNLLSITLPDNITSIGDYTFCDCRSLTSIVIPCSVINIGDYAFSFCRSLSSFTIPSNVKSIGGYAFCKCSGLTSVTISDSVKSIGWHAFSECDLLTNITIGSSVASIGSGAFESCPSISDVICYAEEVPNTNTNAFQYSNLNTATLHVHDASIAKYRSAKPWSSFDSIVALDIDEPMIMKCTTPTIAYMEGRLVFDCETEGVEFVSEIKNADIKKYNDKEVSLIPAYEITVYAMKVGYDDSDIATATIRWRDGHPLFEGFSSVVVNQQEVCDSNGDGTVDVADIATIISAMASKSREERAE